MQAEITRKFQNGNLTPASGIDEIKHIGTYLAERLRRMFSPRSRRLTIRVFARRISPLSFEELRSKLQRALQNHRANECVESSGRKYHVRDINLYGFKACRALIHTLAKGRDGYGMGVNFSFDYKRIRNPPTRTVDATYMSCLSRRTCRLAGGVWADDLCSPSIGQRGFEGVAPYSGQQLRRRQRVRGQYATTPNGAQWRRPGSLRRLP